MNRKDFELVARAVKSLNEYPHTGRTVQEGVALRLCNFISAEGCQGFNMDKFLKACGVNNAAP